MTHQTLNVEGMSCDHCVQTITKAVMDVQGVKEVSVNLEGKQVSVDYDERDGALKEITGAITEAGFQAG